MRRKVIRGGLLALGLTGAAAFAHAQLPALGAGGLLHPQRTRASVGPPPPCTDVGLSGEGIALRGWACRTTAPDRRGAIVYLHGVADNRASSRGAIDRFVPRGFDVIAFDSRAHGESEGDMCTYGYWERRDLARVIDTLPQGPVILFGTSLGAAVALQQAAEDPRVNAVVAAETFSDLRTVATERAPFFFSSSAIARAFEIAEERARFHVDDASPLAAARRITVPVLLIHGAQDTETPPDHSRRVHDALTGSKRLIIVPGAGHNQSLQGAVWGDIEAWIENVISSR